MKLNWDGILECYRCPKCGREQPLQIVREQNYFYCYNCKTKLHLLDEKENTDAENK